MKSKYFFLVSAFFLLACGSIEDKGNAETTRLLQEYRGETQGTTYTVKYIGEKNEQLLLSTDSLLSAIDTSMSTYMEESLISQLNAADSVLIDSMFFKVFSASQKINQLSVGAFDPTIGPLIQAWGFGNQQAAAVDSAMVDSLMQMCGFDKFELSGMSLKKKVKGARLNFNAIAQGFTVDMIGQLLHRFRISDYYIEVGGEVIVKGKNQDNEWWRIGIDQPNGENYEHQLNAIIRLENESMVTSGNYRKFVIIDGKKYSHSINPKTGYPVHHQLLSATIVTPSATEADGIATACMVMGLEKAKVFLSEHIEYQALLISTDGKGGFDRYLTAGLKDRTELVND